MNDKTLAVPQVEVINNVYGFFHRLVCGDRKTSWATYEQHTMLDGFVGITPYYHSGSGVEIITAEQFVALTAVGELK